MTNAAHADLTPTQSKIMRDLRDLPARYRRSGVAGGEIVAQVLDSYDARSWRGLFSKGMLTWVVRSSGCTSFVVAEDTEDADE